MDSWCPCFDASYAIKRDPAGRNGPHIALDVCMGQIRRHSGLRFPSLQIDRTGPSNL